MVVPSANRRCRAGTAGRRVRGSLVAHDRDARIERLLHGGAVVLDLLRGLRSHVALGRGDVADVKPGRPPVVGSLPRAGLDGDPLQALRSLNGQGYRAV